MQHHALKQSVKVDYCGVSDIGLVREQNEDAWMASPEKNLFVLADGMGGHKAGEVAARSAVCTLIDAISIPLNGNPQKELLEAIRFANQAVYTQSQTRSEFMGMGTTLCILFIQGGKAHIGHVGDSRIYRWKSHKLEQITEDHTLLNELIDLQVFSQDEEASSSFRHVLTKAVGTHSSVEPTLAELEIQKNDIFLLCSDGLTNYVSNQEISLIFKAALSIQQAAHALISLAKKHGGGDNITVLIVKIEDLA